MQADVCAFIQEGIKPMTTSFQTDDLRITGIKEVVSPEAVHSRHPITPAAAKTVFEDRQSIHQILRGNNDKLLVVVGPCSIHDTDAALQYARRLLPLRATYQNELQLVMRVYFEKPRTTVGWKGLINDPHLDGTFAINEGIHKARKLLLDINELGMSAGTEFLDLITPQYFADLVSWGAIGARTTESQGHRELASGLSCPVGFKNGTDGSFRIAIDAIRAATHPHHFLSLTKAGQSAIFTTSGNEDCHIILRGGHQPNYDASHVAVAADELKAAGLLPNVMVDFSHANSLKQFERQMLVGADVAGQIAGGSHAIKGVMIESHLHAGRQDVEPGKPLLPGVSITDACIGWEDTEQLLETLAQAVQNRRQNR